VLLSVLIPRSRAISLKTCEEIVGRGQIGMSWGVQSVGTCDQCNFVP